MSDNPLSSENTASIIERAKGIIMRPKEEWPKIAVEPTTRMDVFTRYAVVLAAIGPICGLIGGQVFGYGAFGFHYRPGIVFAVSSAITTYVLSLASLFVVAYIANFLAPKFNGTENYDRAFKLFAYAYTAAWVAGALQIIPSLGFLAALLGLYSLYLFYVGSTPMMGVPEDKAVGFTAVTVVATIVIYLIVGALTAAIMGMAGLSAMDAMAGPSNTDQVNITLPGGGHISATGTEGASTIQMPGMGTIHMDKNGNNMTINGKVDGQDFHAEVQTGN